MPHYMKSIVSVDGANRECRVVVLWDDDDPTAVVCDYVFAGLPRGLGYDPERVPAYVSDEQIDSALTLMGFAIVGKGAPALGWGERIVKRAGSEHSFFDPGTRGWYTTNPSKRSE